MSEQHDAASNVARLAHACRHNADPRLAPAALIEHYCAPGMASGWGDRSGEHSRFHAGAISYAMCYGREHEGYDDGYAYMGALGDAGWVDLPELGDWPYVIYMVWPARKVDPRWCIAHFCEGDFGVEVFDSLEACRDAVRRLRGTP